MTPSSAAKRIVLQTQSKKFLYGTRRIIVTVQPATVLLPFRKSSKSYHIEYFTLQIIQTECLSKNTQLGIFETKSIPKGNAYSRSQRDGIS